MRNDIRADFAVRLSMEDGRSTVVWRGVDAAAVVLVVLMLSWWTILERLSLSADISKLSAVGWKAVCDSFLPFLAVCIYAFARASAVGIAFRRVIGWTADGRTLSALLCGICSGLSAFFIAFTVGFMWNAALAHFGIKDTPQTAVLRFMEGGKIAAFVMACVAAPLTEELLFRTIIMRGIEYDSGSKCTAVLLSSLFFGFTHLNLMALPSVTIAGLCFAGIYYKKIEDAGGKTWSPGITGSIAAHAAFNTASLTLLAISSSSLSS